MTEKPAHPPTPIEAHLTLAEKFARDAREGYCLARVLRDQASAARVEIADPGTVGRILNGKAAPSQQAQATAQAQAIIAAAQQNVLNVFKVAQEIAPLFGMELVVKTAAKPGN